MSRRWWRAVIVIGHDIIEARNLESRVGYDLVLLY